MIKLSPLQTLFASIIIFSIIWSLTMYCRLYIIGKKPLKEKIICAIESHTGRTLLENTVVFKQFNPTVKKLPAFNNYYIVYSKIKRSFWDYNPIYGKICILPFDLKSLLISLRINHIIADFDGDGFYEFADFRFMQGKGLRFHLFTSFLNKKNKLVAEYIKSISEDYNPKPKFYGPYFYIQYLTLSPVLRIVNLWYALEKKKCFLNCAIKSMSM